MTEIERNGLSGEILTKFGISIRPNDEFITLYALIKGATKPLTDIPTQQQITSFLDEMKAFESTVETLANMPTPGQISSLLSSFQGLGKQVETLAKKIEKPKIFNLLDVLYLFLCAMAIAIVFLVSCYLYKKM